MHVLYHVISAYVRAHVSACVYIYIYMYVYIYVYIYTPQIRIGLYTPKTVGVGLVYDLGLLIPS